MGLGCRCGSVARLATDQASARRPRSGVVATPKPLVGRRCAESGRRRRSQMATPRARTDAGRQTSLYRRERKAGRRAHLGVPLVFRCKRTPPNTFVVPERTLVGERIEPQAVFPPAAMRSEASAWTVRRVARRICPAHSVRGGGCCIAGGRRGVLSRSGCVLGGVGGGLFAGGDAGRRERGERDQGQCSCAVHLGLPSTPPNSSEFKRLFQGYEHVMGELSHGQAVKWSRSG